MKHRALVHDPRDDVAVVIEDVTSGTEVPAVTLDGSPHTTVVASQDIPLGHKIALRALAKGQEVTKYGRSIGTTTEKIEKGNYVHTHNITTIRWAHDG